MGEPVQMDLADIEDNTEYRDQKCEKLEDILRKDSRFEGCIVKRIRLQKEAPELKDPFNIQSEDGKHIAWFYEWEFEILSEPEIFSYIEFQKEKEARVDSYLPLDLLGLVFIFAGAVSIITFFLISLASQWTIQGATIILLAASILLPVGILVLIIRRRLTGFRKRGTAFARDDPLFIEALRKLAPLSKSGNKLMDHYAENLKMLEDSIKMRN
jgi:hypothetical protein